MGPGETEQVHSNSGVMGSSEPANLRQKLQTEVLVIGGGATGTGVVRDLAMRGFKTILVEKGDLTHGTTGRYHGLLHSGGRYVVKDPQAAIECIEENRILRHIMPHCIEDTGGYFVVTPWDNPAYGPRFLEGCRQAGIPVEDVPIAQMLREEPLLNPRISQCFRVPDASADSFQGADANADSARQYGAQILPYHKTITLLVDKAKSRSNTGGADHPYSARRVVGARCYDRVKHQEVDIYADLVVNAAGAWAGQIAASAGINVAVVPGKGVMIAVNHRIVNTVINRCKMPSDGDILVPAHTVAVIGTTDVKITDPDNIAIEPWEVQLMLDEGEKIIPGFQEMRMLRAWAGVRPLYQESSAAEGEYQGDTRDVTRAFVLLDHEDRDELPGLVTITSGKWTTYRKMAETTVDLVCRKLGVSRPCKTHLEQLPHPGGAHTTYGHHYLGGRLAQIEQQHAFGQLVCECELATVEDVIAAINTNQARTIDDIRRDVRLGMGPCQGGFCTYRVAGLLHRLKRNQDGTEIPVEETNLALRDFLQERWKGLLPILWGQQLRQERLDELIYLSLLNTDHLLGPQSGRLSPEPYGEPPSITTDSTIPDTFRTDHGTQDYETRAETPFAGHPGQSLKRIPQVLVIGAGLAGLVAAWRTAASGQRVRVIAKGWGALYWHTGCIDVLGYTQQPGEASDLVVSPSRALATFVKDRPDHPYALAGLEVIQQALKDFKDLCAAAGYPLYGDLDQNWLLPTALGTARPTCLAPETMIVGDLERTDPILVAGFEMFQDFYPGLIAANLNALGIPAQGLRLDLPELRQKSFVTGRVLAELFEQAEFRRTVAMVLHDLLQKLPDPAPARIGFPAVLGLNSPLEVKRDLEQRLGLPVFEIPTLPPSIPGIRLHRLLVKAIERMGGRVFEGMQVTSADVDPDGIIQAVWSEAAARRRANPAGRFILATGGILGGGLKALYQGSLQEIVFGLPTSAPKNRKDWLSPQFLGDLHPLYQCGVRVNQNFQPMDEENRVVFKNLSAAGTGLAGGDYLRERSYDGVALVSGYMTGQMNTENVSNRVLD